MEIARAAAALFVQQGLRATRAEDIAQRAGIAPRTFYRYFATKEEAIAPLYAAGSLRWTDAVRTAPPELSVVDALEYAVRHTLTPGVGVSAASWEWVRTLVRLAEDSPAARKVWAEVCQDSERILADVLAERVGSGGGPDNVAPRLAASPRLRFAAAVASAAVRVAVESWATGDESATGPEGPTALALRNVEALRGFSWEKSAGE
ncbi:TetR family transcriptional regulator [Streptomyces mangrovisoli]|uniref:TetR family transcriptional regulator n=2 Tax=Streptomyces mangrovisoli TaxID=1428628 RepID=A0A1J4P1K3_9ACTN|nr:TetR family transcriptional regulator [Streptomyces mangrovisoli]OIJ67612.1 TetR family transcriptional regulator [Streptomyces mangrovisoli]